ncbi:MAG: GTPase domain-containing protein [Clostridiales bacterium]|jgi:hypothetical protein|nr:GTPase domain-containing protein [Clostridiales bacterium]
MFFGLFKKKPAPTVRRHFDVICLNTSCMEAFDHSQRLFRLNPPDDVASYHRSKYIGGDLEDSADPAQPDDMYAAIPSLEPSKSPNPAFLDDSRLKEMEDYYYGGNDEPRCVTIESIPAHAGRGRARRLYYKDDPGTGFVSSIYDEYGNRSNIPVCPYCHAELYVGAGIAQTKIVPVLGVTQSGKSVMFEMGLDRFMRESVKMMLPQGAAYQNAEGKEYLSKLAESLKSRNTVEATNQVKRLMWNIDSDSRSILFITFDMPGEYIGNSMDASNKKFREKDLANVLFKADGLIIVISPEQLESIVENSGMRSISDMIQLVCNESDPARVLHSKNVPAVVLLTKLDKLKPTYKGKLSLRHLDHGLKEEIMKILDLEEYSPSESFVDMGALGNISGITEQLFRRLFMNEINMISTTLLGNANRAGCFAASIQGSDDSAEENAAPIRPFDSFYWLFAKMGIFRVKPTAVSASRRRLP